MSNSCQHSHGHNHAHHHHYAVDGSSRNIAIAFALNFGFAIVELVGGWWTQSVAIQADAIHDLGDSLALLAALGLQIWAKTEANQKFHFGFKRLSLLSAFGTSLILLLGSTFIITRAIERLSSPITPHLDGMFGLAILGVMVNGAAAWKIGKGATQNERALSWHMVEDLLGWVAVLLSSIAMRYVDWPWLDPVLSLVIAGIVILGASRNLLNSSQLFLQAAPKINLQEVKTAMSRVPQVLGLESVKIWSLDGAHHVANIHVRVANNLTSSERMELKRALLERLKLFGEFDVTIEFDEQC